jgi:hypothetical protein
MSTIAFLQTALTAAAEKLWPELSPRAEFHPLVDLSLGDVGSGIAVELAEKLHVSPDSIAEKLLGRWTLPPGVEANMLRGYINVRFLSGGATEFESEPLSPLIPKKLGIVVAPFSKTAVKLAKLRLWSTALSQLIIARHLGIEAALYRGKDALLLSDAASVIPVFRSIIEQLAAEEAQPAATGAIQEAFDASADCGAISLWIVPHALDRNGFVTFCREAEARGQRLSVIGPPSPWFDFRFHEENVADFSAWTDTELLALIWHLAESVPGVDIDFATPRSAERANIFWFLESTHQRLERLINKGTPGVSKAEPPSALMRNLGMRIRFLNTFYTRAVTHGRIQDFMDVLRDTLISINRVFNEPDFRVRHARGGLNPLETKILAGARDLLSGSITLYDFPRELDYGSNAGTAHKTNRSISGNYE